MTERWSGWARLAFGLLLLAAVGGSACESGGGGEGADGEDTGRVTGLVLDEAGAGVPSAEVTTEPASGVALTDADGAFELTGLAAGTYTVRAVREGIGAGEDTDVVVTAGGTTIVDLTLVGAARGGLAGVVSDEETAAPLAGATVTAGDAATETDADGAYAFADLPAGPVSVTAALDGYAPRTATAVVAGDETATLDFALRSLDTSGALAGTVTGGACDTAIVGAVVVTEPATSEVVTDADGAWRIEGVAPGTYTVRVTADGYAPAEPDSVTVEERETTSWDTCLAALPSYDTTCEGCHLQEAALLADLEADPLPEEPGEAGSAGEG